MLWAKDLGVGFVETAGSGILPPFLIFPSEGSFGVDDFVVHKKRIQKGFSLCVWFLLDVDNRIAHIQQIVMVKPGGGD